MKISYLFLLPALACAADHIDTTDPNALKNLSSFKPTGVERRIVIEQKGEKAQNIRKNILPHIKLPEGFKVELFAVVPDARHMAVIHSTGSVFVGTRKDKVWVALDRDMDNVADTVEQFVPGLKFDIPNGVCYSQDGHLYVAERNRVLWFPAPEYFHEQNDAVAIPIVKQGGLIPKEDESYNHTARVCVIGPDNKLYISLGQPFNVAPKDKYRDYLKNGIGSIVKMNRFPGPKGPETEIVVDGILNSVGHAFNPKDDVLWWTDNQVDGMGDETPPGELNKDCFPKKDKISRGGHPWYGGGNVRTNDYKDMAIPKDLAERYCPPQVEMRAHAADLGMMFYTGKQFPEKYHGAIFSAQHGSWNATKPSGAQVMITYLDKNGNAAKTEPFATGWIDENGRYRGRPVDVQQYVNGSILVSDDKAGVIYRIYYDSK